VKLLAILFGVAWLLGWLLLNSVPEAIINLFVGAAIGSLLRGGVWLGRR